MFTMRKLVRPAALVALLTFGFFSVLSNASPSIAHEEEKRENILTVQGSSEYQVEPDVGSIELGIEADRKSAGDAQVRVSEVVSDFIKSLLALGVKSEEIKTIENRLDPVRNYDVKPPKIISYTAVQKIRVRIVGKERLELLSKIVDLATQKSINTIDSIVFSVSPELLKEANKKALQLASVDGLENAKAVLNVLSLTFARVKEVNLQPQVAAYNSYRPMMYNKSVAAAPEMADSGGSQIMSGYSVVRATVNLVIEYR